MEEHYVEDDISSLSHISDIKVSNAPQKHEYGKERVERNIYDKVYNACLKGKLSTIKDIFRKHNTAVMQDEDGQTPLYAACIGDHTEVVKLLIDFGYDVNHQDKEEKTPLHIAFENHAPDIAQTLITQFKANTEIRDKQNWTPLHTAIDRGYFSYTQELSRRFLHQDVDSEVSWIELHAASFSENNQDVQFLLDAGTDVNHVSSAGHTPLLIAATKSNIDLVTLLLDQDAYINSVTIDGKTPLHIAVEKDDDVIIQKLLAQHADPRLKDAPGNTSLHLAVRIKQITRSEHVKTGVGYMSPFLTSYHTSNVQTVQAIIDHGADVNAVNNRGQTALWFACIDGQDSIVKVLMDTGADPSIVDKYRDSCLHAAIHGQCSTETIQKIIDHGADVNAVNNDGATPLLLACSKAQAESAELLLNVGADPNIADGDGDASILSAIDGYCSVNTMHKLIANGANVNATNNKGLTALLKACSYGQMDVVKVLLEAGADPTIVDDVHYSSLHAAVDGRCNKDTLRALIDHGAHIDATRKDGTNALLRACTTGQSKSVIVLLEAGAGVSITKPNGNTCLHTAIEGKCHKEAVQKIIEQGHNVNNLNKSGKTALFLACQSAQAESVKLLLEKGADPNILDAEDYTGLHAAVYANCRNETLQEIITHGVYLDAQNIDGQTALWLACSYRQHNSIKILLEAGSNPNIASNDKNTSLHVAVKAGCSKSTIYAIIDHGADVNATNKENVTALMTVSEKGNKNAINVLFNAGADPHIADADGDTCLHYAVRTFRCTEVLQAIISHGLDVNATNKGNVTALMIACEKGNKDAMNVLLNAGADPDIADIDGDACLQYAARSCKCTAVLQAIISHGADVNATNKENVTALMIACETGSNDAINVLLNAGADPNIADAEGDTCLHYAARNDQCTEVLQVIISHGIDVNTTNKKNVAALVIACHKGNTHEIQVLLNAGADPNIADADGDTCLHYAAQNIQCTEILQAIISHGADVNATNKENVRALMIACQKGNKNTINELLNAGADPNIADIDGDTCLHYGAQNDQCTEVLQAIISHGSDVNAVNKDNVTALMIACEKKNTDAINVLLNAGADANIVDVNDVNAIKMKNVTALMVACHKGNTDEIKILLNAGADPNIANAVGYTCLHYAAGNYQCTEILQEIISHGANVNAVNKENVTALMTACEKKNTNAINVLLNAGADANTADADGDTCLHYTAQNYQCKEVLQAIISHGVDVNATNKKSVTALMTACHKGNTDEIQVLLNAGANSNIADAGGDTWLHYAAENYQCKEVLQAIISHGVDVNVTNQKNVTALMTACQKGNKDAINVLLNAGSDPNIADAGGDTWLHYAVRNCQCKEILQAIISHGVDVNATNKNNVTALMTACKKGNKDAINVLLNAGSDQNIAEC